MKTIFLLIVAAGSMASCSNLNPEIKLLNETLEAIGGAKVIREVDTLLLEGQGNAYHLGENVSPTSKLPKSEVTEYRQAIDFNNRRWQLRWAQVPRHMNSDMQAETHTLGFDNGIAFNLENDGDVVRLPQIDGQIRQIELGMHPIGLLRAALDSRSQILNMHSIGDSEVIDIITDDGEFSLYIDPQTKLPSKIQSIIYHPLLGDVISELSFTDYSEVNGLMLPRRLKQMLDRFIIAELTLTTKINGDTRNLAAPDSIKLAKPSMPQIIIEVEQIARGIWYLTGSSHHSVVVEFSDYLMLIEAPQGDERTLAVIKRARSLKPQKPLRYLINTHHHFGHSGGIRAAISEGLTIITHQRNQLLYEDIASRPHRLSPDTLARNQKPLLLKTINGKYVLEDFSRRIEVYPIENSLHANTLLMVYFPIQGLLALADEFNTLELETADFQPFPSVKNLISNIQNYELNVNRIVPLHGRIVPIEYIHSVTQME